MFRLLLVFWLACLACGGVKAAEPSVSPMPASAPMARSSKELLQAAAACLERGDEGRACEALACFLAAEPNHRNGRFFYAELLYRRKHLPEALTQFERAIALEQDAPTVDLPQLLQCHGRLVEIADAIGESYLAQLHRGIGLYLLGLERARLVDAGDELTAESLLCKAAKELSGARGRRPTEARPNWYLHQVWRQLGQKQFAQRFLQDTLTHAPFTYLAPAEQRQLFLAAQ